MPSPIIHLEICFKLCEKYSLNLSSELLAGMIAPDAIHMRLNQSWTDKAITHFYEEADKNYELALSMARQSLHDVSPDFKLGYLMHLLTDYLWRERIYTPFFEAFKDKMIRKELHALYYRDMKKIDIHFLSQQNWAREAKKKLGQQFSLTSTPLLTEDELLKWCQKVIEQDLKETPEQKVEKLEYFNLEEIEQFIEQIIEEVLNFKLVS